MTHPTTKVHNTRKGNTVQPTITYFQWHNENEVLDDAHYDAFVHYLDNEHSGFNDTYDESVVERFKNDWIGVWDTFGEFVQEKFNELNVIPEHLALYIDYKQIERDWQHHYWISSEGHVFMHS